MFPNHSSSDEIFSKPNAFVQINQGDEGGSVMAAIQQNPELQVPDSRVSRDVVALVLGEGEEEVPNQSVITNLPSQPAAGEDPTSSAVPLSYSSNYSFKLKNKRENIPQPVCDYKKRWGISEGMRLLGGGESVVVTSGWGASNAPTGSSPSGSTTTTSGTGGWGSNSPPPATPTSGSTASSNNNNTTTTTATTTVASHQPQQPQQQQQQQQQQANSNNNNGSKGVQGPPSQQSQAQQSPTTATSTSSPAGSAGAQPPANNAGSWAQAAGKGLPNNNNSNNNNSQTNTTKQQMEQLNCMREALFSQDGWGGQNVNQDSNWDIPGSPEPGVKENNNAPVQMWKPAVNNGTDLWEANLRNGGLPPPAAQSSKAPWGHTPSNNIGGTWGEEDEMDTSNLWTGVPVGGGAGGNAAAAAGATPGAGQGAGGTQWGAAGNGGPPGVWPGGKKEGGEWGGSTAGGWGAANPEAGAGRGAGAAGAAGMMGPDPREHMRTAPVGGSIDHRGMGSGEALMPRGISGRLNGVTEAMWGAGGTGGAGPHHHHHLGGPPGAHHPGAKVGAGPPGAQPGAQWGGGGPVKGDIGNKGAGVSGWEEPSPPPQRRNMNNYDDGTSLWGQQSRPAMPGQNKVSHWKDIPAGPGGGIPGRGMVGRNGPTMKGPGDNGGLWVGTGGPRGPGVGWETGGGMVDGGWEDNKPGWLDSAAVSAGGSGSWKQQQQQQQQQQHKPPGGGWGDIPPNGDLDGPSWAPNQPVPPPHSLSHHHSAPVVKHQAKGLTKDVIWSSKQFRILTDMGFKKEEAESALRGSGMVLEDALEILSTRMGVGDMWAGGNGGRRHGGDLVEPDPGPPQLLNTYPSPQPVCIFPPPSRSQQQPSTQQLRMLVQQIQMAVQAGFLNSQILNQPLAPQTLILLNQLLQQIKQLHQLMGNQQNLMHQPGLVKPTPNLLHISVQITKTKQHITNLQNQIAATQAVYVKQQQTAAQPPLPPSTEFFKPNLHDPLSTLPTNFSDLGLKDGTPSSGGGAGGGGGGGQSRLIQWKMPLADKEADLGTPNEFSRAPGTTTKPGNSSPNMNPLLTHPDTTWSTTRGEAGWPSESVGSEEGNSNKDWPSQQPAFSDLVPEFEPGKPWKGNPLKSIEEDPSLTPGSVIRSPLSLPSLKDTHILSGAGGSTGKASPTTTTSSSTLDLMAIPPLSLSSSTWSFNPPTSSTGKLPSGSTSGAATSGITKPWGEGNGGDLWTNPAGSKAPRGPPPGLGSSKSTPTSSTSTVSNSANGWSVGSIRWSSGQQGSQQPQQQSGPWGSTWLLLRNLTPQIDGSTLKTLCVQHGPVINFHLYLNQGIAIAKYTSREEASKAQGALNNCVLGNTTIFAESPAESDVHSLLQHLGGQSSSNSSSWRKDWGGGSASGGGGGASVGGGLWGASSGAAGAPWPSSQDPGSGGQEARSTPASLNSFLPGDLLGGESA